LMTSLVPFISDTQFLIFVTTYLYDMPMTVHGHFFLLNATDFYPSVLIAAVRNASIARPFLLLVLIF
jgi:hypothetical protein